MLGRLARYLRFLGYDTVYVRELGDEEVRRLAENEGRVLLTRDRDLARRAGSALLIRSVDVVGQLREVRTAFPHLPGTVRFDRCPGCNAGLRLWRAPSETAKWPDDVPRSRTGPVWECPSCARHYWEGSHATGIRARVAAAWSPEATL
jgi:uncharacterized protein with PIN domain